MNLAGALVVIAAATITAGVTVGYFLVRLAARPVMNPLGSPPCDRCGKDTEKPWLWSQARTAWRCSACDAEVSELVFNGMREAYEQRAKLDEALLRDLANPPPRERPTA